ncbi:hypothetical protein F2P47_08595 [Parvibaculum sedimenti]|uniref:HNH endonuclease 5 domain-containing protein n=1 Tax=Parvibaculum sedimenti TaxID=2608632 RepID=A0A6N6VK68_9HYPH|nr:hypothetical protein F2P47_08595 [Parvibaculum sedimenti]
MRRESLAAVPSRCIICNNVLTKGTDSREHVIPNSIGGRLKVRGFLCVRCNNTSGHKWESDLARDLNLEGSVRSRGGDGLAWRGARPH